MIITKELAARFESCIQQTHLEVTKQYSGHILELNGGAACFSGFDSYLSQVVGWGFNTQPEFFEKEIQKIEAFYLSLHHTRVDIELCPYVGNELAVFLSQRGYEISEFNNVSALDLTEYREVICSSEGFILRHPEKNELDDWAKKMAFGFEYPEAKDQFGHYIRAKGVVVFGIYQGDELVAGATLAVHGEVCDLGVTSTLPAHRGKGLQKQLIGARLNYAKKMGVKWATVTTEPGVVSDLNVQKMGFSCAYTRIKLTRILGLATA